MKICCSNCAKAIQGQCSPARVLRREHVIIETHLNEFEKVLRKMRHGRIDHQAVLGLVDFFRGFADGCHHQKEEQYYLPIMRSKGYDINEFMYEHDEGRAHLRSIAEAVHFNAPQAVVSHGREFITLLRGHIKREDVLFAQHDSTMSPAEKQALVNQFVRS